MSSNFFQWTQNITNVLVDCLPPEYDPSADEIRLENPCDLQRLFEEKIQRNNTSYKNRGKNKRNDEGNESDETLTTNQSDHDELLQNTRIQQIHEIRIATPEWLRRDKDEFRKIQDKRDAMGIHVLSIARVQECNRVLRSLHTSQSWNDRGND